MTPKIRNIVWVCALLLLICIGLSIKFQQKNLPPAEESFLPTPEKFVPVPYVIEGYYSALEKKIEVEGASYGTTTCHTFIETKNMNQINIEIGNLKPDFRNKILQSQPSKQVHLTLQDNPPVGKGAPLCASFVTILDVK